MYAHDIGSEEQDSRPQGIRAQLYLPKLPGDLLAPHKNSLAPGKGTGVLSRPTFKTQRERAAYGVGASVGGRRGLDVDHSVAVFEGQRLQQVVETELLGSQAVPLSTGTQQTDEHRARPTTTMPWGGGNHGDDGFRMAMVVCRTGGRGFGCWCVMAKTTATTMLMIKMEMMT